MNALDVNALLTRYVEGELTTKEVLGQVFSYLASQPNDIFLVLTPLREHPEPSIRELEGTILTLLGVAQTTPSRGDRVG